ncbi:hypothetical protein NHQ30_002457 [Ciborinia camelliae]|nr:hypothetical protein NHQ30_002457 [Ciborinia camelliae]
MEEQNFADFSSNKAEIGSPERRSPPRSDVQVSQSSDEKDTPAVVPSSQYEGNQGRTYRRIAPAPYTQGTYSATFSSSSHQESIYSTSYPDPPPPAVPTPPPHPSHYPPYHSYHSSLYPPHQNPQRPLPHYHENRLPQLRSLQPQSQLHPITTTDLPVLPIPQNQAQYHQQQQTEEAGPWSPLSPHDSRKRRASVIESSAMLGASGEPKDWGYSDKLGKEIDHLMAESRGMGGGRGRGNGGAGAGGVSSMSSEERRKRRRRGRSESSEVPESGNGFGSGGGRGRGRRNDEDEDGDMGAMEIEMGRGRGSGNGYSH